MCHFLDPAHLPKLSDGSLTNFSRGGGFVAPLCAGDNETAVENCDGNDMVQSSGLPAWPVWVLGTSLFLQGIAKAPRVSLSSTYIDNNITVKTKTGFYIGLAVTLNLFGPAAAIPLGGVFRTIPVDLQDTILTPTHPKWIGAWWLGFIMFGALGIVVGIPLLFFPKHILPKEEQEKSTEKSLSTVENIKDLPRSLLRTIRRPVYTLTVMAICFQLFVLAGSQAFESKYIEKQFMVPGYKTNIILGIQTIISASIGTFAGGVVTSRLKLTSVGCLKMATGVLTLALGFNLLEFFLGCDTPYIYGFHDNKGNVIVDDGIDSCICDSTSYFPVCGEAGMTYFSPCFAGCTNQTQSTYGGCREVKTGEATAGMCETDCPYLYYYLAADVGLKLVVTSAILPIYMTLIRSVDPKDKTIAMGLYQFLSSLLGFLPGPILFGYVIDSACLIFGESCGIRGTCAQYDLQNLRFRLKSTECTGRGISIVLIILAYIIVKRQGGDKEVNDEVEFECKKAEKSEMTKL